MSSSYDISAEEERKPIKLQKGFSKRTGTLGRQHSITKDTYRKAEHIERANLCQTLCVAGATMTPRQRPVPLIARDAQGGPRTTEEACGQAICIECVERRSYELHRTASHILASSAEFCGVSGSPEKRMDPCQGQGCSLHGGMTETQ